MCESHLSCKHMKFSIIVAAYNVEAYILRCLNSLKPLSPNLFELIIVNDGSTDKTLFIIKDFLLTQNIKNAKVIEKENGGLSSARNAGLEAASGDYVIFVDGDDYILHEELSKICSSINIEFDVIICPPRVEYQALENLKSNDGVCFSLPFSGPKPIRDLDLFSVSTVAWSKIYRLSLIRDKKITFPEGILYEDNYWYWLFMKEANLAFFSTGTFYTYVRRQGSIMDKTFSKKEGYSIQRVFLLNKLLEDCKKLSKTERQRLTRDYLYAAEQDCPQIEKFKLFYVMQETLRHVPSEDLTGYLKDVKTCNFKITRNSDEESGDCKELVKKSLSVHPSNKQQKFHFFLPRRVKDKLLRRLTKFLRSKNAI